MYKQIHLSARFWFLSWLLFLPLLGQAYRTEIRTDTLAQSQETPSPVAAPTNKSTTDLADGRTDPMALVSLGAVVVGLVGFFAGVPALFLAGILVGIITGIVSLVRIRRSGRQLRGKGYAVTGLVVGLIALLSVALIIAAFSGSL